MKMVSRTHLRLLAALLALVLVLMPAAPAFAADGGCAPGTLCFPAGTACANFDLQIQLGGAGHALHREFLAKDGSIVHVLAACNENALAFTNVTSAATLGFTPHQSLIRIMLNPDDTRTEVATGHSIIVVSPRHASASPSAMLYTGRVIYVVAPGEIFTAWEVGEDATDICAGLSG
jgi:hypothetical protein